MAACAMIPSTGRCRPVTLEKERPASLELRITEKGQNVKQKQNKKKETRHGKVFQAGRMQKKKWE